MSEFGFAQYLENESTEFNLILHTHYHCMTRSKSELLYVISFSNRVMPLTISLSSDSTMAGL